jgi:hypothetical protein
MVINGFTIGGLQAHGIGVFGLPMVFDVMKPI